MAPAKAASSHADPQGQRHLAKASSYVHKATISGPISASASATGTGTGASNTLRKDSHRIAGEINEKMKMEPEKVETKDSSIEKYSMGAQLGHGSYAVVKIAVHKHSGRKVAIKIYEKYRLASSQRKGCVNREIKLLKKLEHPNIVRLHEIIDCPKQLYLVMELARGKSMLQYVRSKSDKKLEESECILVFRQILEALHYCHAHNVAHRDIKMENILLDERLKVKIIDFGFCAYGDQKLKIFCGTPSYMPPEIVNKQEYFGPPADMWSLGVLLFSTLCGYFPFRGDSEPELYRLICKGNFSIPYYLSPPAQELISKLLVLDPTHRLTAEQVSSQSSSLA